MTRLTLMPGGRREVSVVGHRPHRLPDLGALQHDGDQDQDGERDDDRCEVGVGHPEQAVVDRPLAAVVRVRLGPAAEDDLVQVPQQHRQADRDDQRGDQAGAAAAQRPPDGQLVERPDARADHHGDQRRGDERHTALDVDEPRGDRTDGDQLAVREVGQAGGAEDQREPDRGHGDEQAEAQALDEQLHPADGATSGAGAAVAERDDHALVASGVDGHRAGVLAGEDHALGQPLLVDRHGVLARPGQGDHPPAVLVGLDRVDLAAVGGGDDHLDALDRPGEVGLEGARHLLGGCALPGLGGRDAGSQRQRHTTEDAQQEQAEQHRPRWPGSRTRPAPGRAGPLGAPCPGTRPAALVTRPPWLCA
jgi:hypothetical protein